MADETLDSDLGIDFQFQMQEAIASSLALRPSAEDRDGVGPSTRYNDDDSGLAKTLLLRDINSRTANDVFNLQPEYWIEHGNGRWHEEKPNVTRDLVDQSEVFRLYFKGLVSEERVRESNVVVAGAGVAIYDSKDKLVFLSRKNLDAFHGGEVISGEAAELQALVEGLNQAFSSGFSKITFFCDDDSIFDYVTHRLPPKNGKVAELVNQVRHLRTKFNYCGPSLVAHDGFKFAFKCAQEAIVSQLTWSEEAGKGKSLKETCMICCDDIDVTQMFSIDGCLHRYCFSCIKCHVETRLYGGQIARCPHDGCNSELAIDSCAKFLPPNLVELMSQVIKESAIPATQKVYCPYPKCSALMSKDEVSENTKAASFKDAEQSGARKCMKCQKFFCINCKVPFHCTMTCDDYRRQNPHGGEDEQMLKSLATEKLWRQCANCNNMIELLEGCNHITCRCKYEFCYVCGAEWKNKMPSCACPIRDERNIIWAEQQQILQRLPQLQPQLEPGLVQQLQRQQQLQQRLRLQAQLLVQQQLLRQQPQQRQQQQRQHQIVQQRQWQQQQQQRQQLELYLEQPQPQHQHGDQNSEPTN